MIVSSLTKLGFIKGVNTMKVKDGFTLIEVIVSIAIMGIVAISMLTVFNAGLVNIIRAGNRTEAVYDAEADLVESPAVLSYENITIKVPTPYGENSVIINGGYVKGEASITSGFGSVTVDFEEFIPGLIESVE